ncbi:MAG TPA: hypothetical protein VGV67_09115 [Solirubrobacteraceae bacterium]|nr:hypothetical protein [Solirubrobacteraceae bacterium]
MRSEQLHVLQRAARVELRWAPGGDVPPMSAGADARRRQPDDAATVAFSVSRGGHASARATVRVR